MRSRLRRLERRAANDHAVVIPQPNGEPPAKFREDDLLAAFSSNVARLRNRDVPAHPLAIAAARSPDPEWSKSFYAACWANVVGPPVVETSPGVYE